MKGKIALVIALSALFAVGAFAQTADTTVPTFAVENGYDFAYIPNNAAANAFGGSYRLSIQYGLSDKLQAEFSFIPGDGSGTNFLPYTLLGLNYLVLPRAGVSIYMGSRATAVAIVSGMGIWANVFGKSVSGSLQTGLRLRVDYIAPVTAFNTGMVRVGMAAFVGM